MVHIFLNLDNIKGTNKKLNNLQMGKNIVSPKKIKKFLE